MMEEKQAYMTQAELRAFARMQRLVAENPDVFKSTLGKFPIEAAVERLEGLVYSKEYVTREEQEAVGRLIDLAQENQDFFDDPPAGTLALTAVADKLEKLIEGCLVPLSSLKRGGRYLVVIRGVAMTDKESERLLKLIDQFLAGDRETILLHFLDGDIEFYELGGMDDANNLWTHFSPEWRPYSGITTVSGSTALSTEDEE